MIIANRYAEIVRSPCKNHSFERPEPVTARG